MRAREDLWLTGKIEAIHRRSRGVYVSPMIHAELADDHGIRVGRKRVARLMRAAGLRGASQRRFVVTTTADLQASRTTSERISRQKPWTPIRSFSRLRRETALRCKIAEVERRRRSNRRRQKTVHRNGAGPVGTGRGVGRGARKRRSKMNFAKPWRDRQRPCGVARTLRNQTW